MPRLAIVLIVLLCSPLSAWSTKEHLQLTRLAAKGLLEDSETPAAMKDWLRAAAPDLMDMDAERDYLLFKRVGIVPRAGDGLSYWTVMPDMMTFIDRPDRKIAPYDVHERLLHYIDVEFFHRDESMRRYRHDLSGKPNLTDIPRNMRDPRYERAGMLPFRVEECYRQLVLAFREGRLVDQPGQYPRDDHATKWAGYLAHYLQDNTQPHHATIDYKSASYFADQRNAPNVHAQMEYIMPDDEHNDYMELREEFWPLFVESLSIVQDPIETDDPWLGTIEMALFSYDALPLIGLAAMAAAKQGGTPDRPEGPAAPFDTVTFMRYRGEFMGREMSVLEMKAHQMALAVRRTQRLWRQAWDEAHGR